MKEIIRKKDKSPVSQIYHGEKQTNIQRKKEIAETFNSYFVDVGSNLAASISKSKTSFQAVVVNTTVLASVPSILRTYNWEMHLRASKQTKVQDMMIYLPMLSKECPKKYLLF